MTKKKTQEQIGWYHCFSPGDLCRGQFGDMFVILKVENSEYHLVQLQDRTIHCLGESPITIKKGEVIKQSVSIFDKYHYLYQPK